MVIHVFLKVRVETESEMLRRAVEADHEQRFYAGVQRPNRGQASGSLAEEY